MSGAAAVLAAASLPTRPNRRVVKRPRKPRLDLISAEELRERFERVRAQLFITRLPLFYTVSGTAVRKHEPSLFNIPLVDALAKAYPEHTWYPWLFSRAPDQWHDSAEQRRRFFDFVPRSLRLERPDDLSHWYSIPIETVWRLGGERLLRRHYRCSLFEALRDVYPDHKWEQWRFPKAPDNHLQDLDQQRSLMDDIGKRLGITAMDQWYKVEKLQVVKMGGAALIKEHKHSLHAALKKIYPDHTWLPWLFTKAPKAFWNSKDNQRQFMDWCMKQLNLKRMDEWYMVPRRSLEKLGASGLLTHQYDAVSDLLQAVYPEHRWYPWKFTRCPMAFWSSIDNRRAYFHWLGNELGYSTIAGGGMESWYNLTTEVVKANYGGGMIHSVYQSSMYRAMVDIFPNHSWDPLKFAKVGSLSTPTS